MRDPNITKVLLSLHGFHSSPGSLKAQQMREYLASEHPDIHFVCPQLPVFPQQMWETIQSIFSQYEGCEISVMGSSLGGFLATKVAQEYSAKVILINPAVTPDLLLTRYQGEQTHPHLLKKYFIDQGYVQQLVALNIDNINHPENIWVLLQEGDEVLDYREALRKYSQCKITCEKGGDHSFVGFERYLAEIIHFLY
ncbi:YqiA/YcfP family alpha/beta fold hydrolase [Psychromonas arctica]|uniref:YqiA/YcfP family alpha/beta fold hydrolase n=1 Tax=Psychromonas arctica TaxID=168275 RepID=UPI002FCF8FAE